MPSVGSWRTPGFVHDDRLHRVVIVRGDRPSGTDASRRRRRRANPRAAGDPRRTFCRLHGRVGPSTHAQPPTSVRSRGRTIRRRWSWVSPGVVDALPRTGKCALGERQATWMPTELARVAVEHAPAVEDEAAADRDLADADRSSSTTWIGACVLRWTATWTLVEDELTVLDQFATPDTPRLGALEGPVEALGAEGTARTDGFRSGDVEELVAEEQMGEGARAVAAASGGPLRDGGGEFVEGRFDDCIHGGVRLSGSGVR